LPTEMARRWTRRTSESRSFCKWHSCHGVVNPCNWYRYSGVKRKTAYVPPALRRLASGTPSDAAAAATPSPTAQPEKKDNKDVQTQAQGAAPATTASTATPEKPATKTARGGKVVSTETKPEATPAVASPVPVLNVTAADGETPKKEGRTPEKLRTVRREDRCRNSLFMPRLTVLWS
jgi:hypothetical protein